MGRTVGALPIRDEAANGWGNSATWVGLAFSLTGRTCHYVARHRGNLAGVTDCSLNFDGPGYNPMKRGMMDVDSHFKAGMDWFSIFVLSG